MANEVESSAATESLASLQRLFDDPNIRFPARPTLAEDVSVFQIPDGLGVQFRSQEIPVLIRGRDAGPALNYLLSAMDGSRAVAELVDRCPDGVSRSAVFRTLWLLKTKGLLRGGAEEPIETRDDGIRRQLLFWGRHLSVTHSADSSVEMQRRLETTRIAIVGTGAFGVATYDVLARSGCQTLSVLAWDDDGLMAKALPEQPVAPQQFLELGTVSVDEVENRLRVWVEGADLVLTATRNAPVALFEAINRVCLSAEVPWLRGAIDGSLIEIGPYVYPYSSACFTCMELRKRSMAKYAVEEQLYQEDLARERPAGATRPIGEAVVFSTLAASLIASEVVRILTEISPPTLLDCVLSVSPVKGTFETNQILRVPRCPDCYTGTVPTKVS